MAKDLILFFDCGDTIIDQGTECRKIPNGIVYKAQCIPGAAEAVRLLYEQGYTMALVADGLAISFGNMLGCHDLIECFDAFAISETVGYDKPDGRMFQTAMEQLHLTEKDKNRIIMIGNNLERDIVGANMFGIRSILLTWSPRYRMEPQTEEEKPTYTIAVPSELPQLLSTLKPL